MRPAARIAAAPLLAAAGIVVACGGASQPEPPDWPAPGLAIAPSGLVIVADPRSHTIVQITPDGVRTLLAGAPGEAGSADGPAADARFDTPTGVAVDAAGVIYVADYGNSTIRKITPDRMVRTLAGAPGQRASVDGPPPEARFSGPAAVAVDRSGRVYVADRDSHTIRTVSPDGAVSTLAGTAGRRGSADGVGGAARFYAPTGVAVDASGNVFVADTGNSTIRVVATDGVTRTLAGAAGQNGRADGAGPDARFSKPVGIAVDAQGALYVADTGNSTIRKVTPDGFVSTLAGSAGQTGDVDGTGGDARFDHPTGVAVDPSGNVYVADAGNNAIRVSTPGGVVTTVAIAPTGTMKEVSIPTSGSRPFGIALGPDKNLWFTESDGNRIGRITTSGTITEFSIPTSTSSPTDITAGPDGTLWFTESAGNKIGRITTTGTITEFPIPTSASYPLSIVAGSDGNLWFTEFDGNKVGRITTGGNITEFSCGGTPHSIALGSDGNLWFTEKFVNRIGRITTSGTVTEFPIPTSTSNPLSIAAGPDGNLWFAESAANKVGRITTSGTITEFSIPASTAYPVGIALGPDGNLWFTESAGNKIGRITTTGTVTEFSNIPTSSSEPSRIIAGPDGNLWFTEGVGNKIGRIAP